MILCDLVYYVLSAAYGIIKTDDDDNNKCNPLTNALFLMQPPHPGQFEYIAFWFCVGRIIFYHVTSS